MSRILVDDAMYIRASQCRLVTVGDHAAMSGTCDGIKTGPAFRACAHVIDESFMGRGACPLTRLTDGQTVPQVAVPKEGTADKEALFAPLAKLPNILQVCAQYS